MLSVRDLGQHALQGAHLPEPLARACVAALSRPGRLFSSAPIWARLFLAWIDTLTGPATEPFLAAAVACEYMIAGYDLIDAADDQAPALSPPRGAASIHAGVILLLLAQELLARLHMPADRRARLGAAFARGGRRALIAQAEDLDLRHLPAATPSAVLAVIDRRSGALAAIPCQCAALSAGAPWRIVALAGRFGRALGCAAQLEDDLADRAEDARSGRKTIPTVLAALHPGEPDLAEALTWVLIQRFLKEAEQALARLPEDQTHSEAVWNLLPPALRPGSRC